MVQKLSNSVSFLESSLTSEVTSVLTSVVAPTLGAEVGSTVAVAALLRGISYERYRPSQTVVQRRSRAVYIYRCFSCRSPVHRRILFL